MKIILMKVVLLLSGCGSRALDKQIDSNEKELTELHVQSVYLGAQLDCMLHLNPEQRVAEFFRDIPGLKRVSDEDRAVLLEALLFSKVYSCVTKRISK